MEYRGFQPAPGGIQVKHWLITPSNQFLNPRPWSIKTIAEGVAILEDEDGRIITYPTYVGEIFPFSPVKVLPGTTADLVGWR